MFRVLAFCCLYEKKNADKFKNNKYLQQNAHQIPVVECKPTSKFLINLQLNFTESDAIFFLFVGDEHN